MRKDRIFLPLVVLLCTPLLFAVDSEVEPAAAVCSMSPVAEAILLAPPCRDCTVSQFSPRFGIVCTFAQTCQPGANGCCEYTCSCGASCDLSGGTPDNACALDLPTNCCPGFPTACVKSYCDGFGVRCEACGCGVGCCAYKCGVPDPSCTGFDPIPPGAC